MSSNLLEAGFHAMRIGDYQRVEQIFQKVLLDDPTQHQAWNLLAIAATLQGMPDVGVERSLKALQGSRKNPYYLNTMAVALGELGRLEEAKLALTKAVKYSPGYAEAHYNLGKTFYKLEKIELAEMSYLRAYKINPDYPGLRFNLAFVYRLLGNGSRARELLLELLQKNPDDADAMVQLSEIDSTGLDVEEHLEYLASLIQSNPGLGPVREKLARLRLQEGLFEAGWQEYWYRMSLPKAVRDARFGTPVQLLGNSLDGVRILVRTEQGFGDMLFFARFLPELKRRGAVVLLEVENKLAEVLSNCDCIDALVPFRNGDPDNSAKGVDQIIWAGDLPLLLQLNGSQKSLRLVRDRHRSQYWADRLASLGPGPILGVTWRAGTDPGNAREFNPNQNPNRALWKQVPISDFLRCVNSWPGKVVILQRNPYPRELAAIHSTVVRPILDLSAVNEDLVDMLALLSCIDEYVAVSNTNVHLRTALGLNGRVLLPEPEFRWLSSGTESPWFPDWKIYRKTSSMGWVSAFNELERDLQIWA